MLHALKQGGQFCDEQIKADEGATNRCENLTEQKVFGRYGVAVMTNLADEVVGVLWVSLFNCGHHLALSALRAPELAREFFVSIRVCRIVCAIGVHREKCARRFHYYSSEEGLKY